MTSYEFESASLLGRPEAGSDMWSKVLGPLLAAALVIVATGCATPWCLMHQPDGVGGYEDGPYGPNAHLWPDHPLWEPPKPVR